VNTPESSIVIDEVLLNDAPAGDLRFTIDTPATGATADGYLVRAQGWALGADIHAITAYDVGTLVASSSEWHARPDVDTAVECGFTVDIPTLGLPTTFELKVCAETPAGRVRLATVNGRRRLLPADKWDDDGPSLLAITGLGRSGTSWLMHLLGRHDDIVIDPRWPQELSSTTFGATTLRRLLDHPHGLDHPPTQELTASGTWWTSWSPYELPGVPEWYAGEHVEILAHAMRDDMSSLARARAKRSVRYFAEKTRPNTDTRLALELFPRAREIVLVRDFRDVLTSIFAFNARRGDAFGRDRVESDADYVRLFAGSCRALETWVERNPEALIVKYEDLVSDSKPALRRILSHLDLPASASDATTLLAASDTDEMQDHRTSDTPAESIGRWRTDLPTDLQELAEQEFRQSLNFFDYA